MRAIALAAIGIAAIAAQSVSAQMLPSAELRGFRIEGNAGGDRFNSLGTHNNKFGYGATIGFDGVIADKFVIGPEGSIWLPNHGSTNRAPGINGGEVSSNSSYQYGAAVRAGYLVTPNLLVFGKGGWVRNDQRMRFDAAPGQLFYVGGQIVGPEQSYFHHQSTDGYQAGGGVEYTLPSFGGFTLPIYVSAQYVYANYEDHTRQQRLMGGVGIRFK